MNSTSPESSGSPESPESASKAIQFVEGEQGIGLGGPDGLAILMQNYNEFSDVEEENCLLFFSSNNVDDDLLNLLKESVNYKTKSGIVLDENLPDMYFSDFIVELGGNILDVSCKQVRLAFQSLREKFQNMVPGIVPTEFETLLKELWAEDLSDTQIARGQESEI